MSERLGLARSVVDLGSRALDVLKSISYYKRRIEPEIEEGRRVMDEVRQKLAEKEHRDPS